MWSAASPDYRFSGCSWPTISVGHRRDCTYVPLCCLNEGGLVGWVIGELNGRFFEFANCKCGKGPIIFKAVCKRLRDGFNDEVEGGHRFVSPCVVKNDMFETLSGCCERWFLWGESAMGKTLLSSFKFGFLFALRRWRGLRGSHPIIVGSQSGESRSIVWAFY